jgi:hypothetical protein
MFVLCSLPSFWEWSSCYSVQCTHLRYTDRLAHALHGKTQMRELNRYTEQVLLTHSLPHTKSKPETHGSSSLPLPSDVLHQPTAVLVCVALLHWEFGWSRTVAVWLSWQRRVHWHYKHISKLLPVCLSEWRNRRTKQQFNSNLICLLPFLVTTLSQ